MTSFPVFIHPPSFPPWVSHPPIPLSSFMCRPARGPGYKDVVVHEALAEVAHDGVLSDLGQQHHVIHTALFHIVALPVEALLAALGVGWVGVSPDRGRGWVPQRAPPPPQLTSISSF